MFGNWFVDLSDICVEQQIEEVSSIHMSRQYFKIYPNFFVYRNDRLDGACVGVTIIIHRRIACVSSVINSNKASFSRLEFRLKMEAFLWTKTSNYDDLFGWVIISREHVLSTRLMKMFSMLELRWMLKYYTLSEKKSKIFHLLSSIGNSRTWRKYNEIID